MSTRQDIPGPTLDALSSDDWEDLLQQLALEHESDAPRWIEQECESTPANMSLYDLAEEDADVCNVSFYDPALFSPLLPASPMQSTFQVSCDKPLPRLPGSSRTPPPPPPTPKTRSYISPSHPWTTPPSSPRESVSSQSLVSSPIPRSRPPSAHVVTLRSVQSHATFPSISSTLSLLEERETEVEKRSGVIVTETEEFSPDSEAEGVFVFPTRSITEEPENTVSEGNTLKKSSHPTLNLSTASSSPTLQTLADLATMPLPSPQSLMHQSSLSSLASSAPSPLPFSSLLPAFELEEPISSRWSMDSHSERPNITPTAESPQPKIRKRDRLLSFISRRAGSQGKQSSDVPPTPTIEAMESSAVPSSPRPSISTVSVRHTPRKASQGSFSPVPLSASPSMSSSSSAETSLVTPADSQFDVSVGVADPFCPASPTFAPSSFLPEPEVKEMMEAPPSPPLSPTLPLPCPNTPTPSFFLPQSPPSFPFIPAIARRKFRRRKKLIISGIPFAPSFIPLDQPRSSASSAMYYENITKWCEKFGEVKRLDKQSDGSIHVLWKNKDVADLVCRINAQVHIKGVGRVHVTWGYAT